VAAAGIAGAIVTGLFASPAGAATPPGAQQLEQKVDSVVGPYMAKYGVPGLNVAVSKGGKLILTKGYGQAGAAGGQSLPMRADMRTRIGSVTKAVMTGPATWELLKAHNYATDTKLYGPEGFFKGQFDADIEIVLKKIADAPSAGYNPTLESYRKITLQHLFDHRAGFIRSGDLEGAADMFGDPKEELTYAQAHQFMLRTHPLWYEPGTEPSVGDPYSNHGFGIMTMIVERLSRKSFPEYTRDDYLKPMGLHNSVRGEWAAPDSCDSFNYIFAADGDGDPSTPPPSQVLPFARYDQGLAAGGLRASAQDLVRIMENLTNQYKNPADIDAMGWGMDTEGRMAHSGAIKGGNSYVNMYKDDYTANPKLAGVKIAVVSNIDVDTKSVAIAIAKQVAATTVESDYNLWPETLAAKGCEYSRHGVPAADFSSMFNEAHRHGYRLEWVDGYTVGGKVFFNSVFRSGGPAVGWAAHVEMSPTTYAAKRDYYKSAGFSLAHVDSYAVGNTVRYAAIWTKGTSDQVIHQELSVAQHQQSYEALRSQGWTPKVISVAVVNGLPQFTALYTKQPAGTVFSRAGMSSAEYQTIYTQQKEAGRKLSYLNAYLENGQINFTAIWTSEPQGSLTANHGLTATGLTDTWWKNLSAGFETKAVTGYEDGGQHEFAAFWTK
jgi:CubicO group peptidase (beta-lactamase class C family)